MPARLLPLALAATALSATALSACAGSGTTDTGDTGTAELSPTCPDGVARRAWRTDGLGFGFTQTAGDFTLATPEGGPFTLSEWWDGCHSLVVLMHRPESPTAEAVWGSDPSLLVTAHDSTHYLLVSNDESAANRENALTTMRDRIVEAGGTGWDARVHVGLDRLDDAEGALGDFFRDYNAWRIDPENFVDLGDRGIVAAPPLAFLGIDRDQRWDSIGTPSEFVGGPSTFKIAGTAGGYYHHLAKTVDRAATEQAEVVPLVDEVVTERIFIEQAELPADLSAFDTLEVDVQIICEERNVFACSEWDRIARIQVCVDGEACEERQELVRWITPYWRRGERRWIWDATPLLPLLKGGTNHFRVEMGPSWERPTPRIARMSLRLRTTGQDARPSTVLPAYSGGNFTPEYNDREPLTFDAPASFSRAELVWILSGHGQDPQTNCAEWCNHTHDFTLNGTQLDRVASPIPVGSPWGCGDLTAEGVQPGGFGNWAQGRAYWCPAWPLPVDRMDITDLVQAGQSNEMTYFGSVGGLSTGNGNIVLTSYVVFYD